jgi:hypothetical protein
MSEFAFLRFTSNNMLTIEERQHKDEIIDLTERVLHVRGIECDDRISKLSEEKLKEILEEVRKLRKRRKGMDHQDRTEDDDDSDSSSKKEALYIR